MNWKDAYREQFGSDPDEDLASGATTQEDLDNWYYWWQQRQGNGGQQPASGAGGKPSTTVQPLPLPLREDNTVDGMSALLTDRQKRAQLEFDITKEAATQAYNAAMAAQAARIANQNNATARAVQDARNQLAAATTTAEIASAQENLEASLSLQASTTNATLGQRQSEAQGGLTLDAAKQNAVLAANAAAQHVQMVFNAEVENSRNRLAVLNLVASLKGPRNAFVQQAVVNGLNSAGLSKAIDAAAGRVQLPSVQGDQAVPQPMTLQSFLDDSGLVLPGEIRAPAEYETPDITAPTLAPFSSVSAPKIGRVGTVTAPAMPGDNPIDMPTIPAYQPPTNAGGGAGGGGAGGGGLSQADAINQARQQLGAHDKSWLSATDAEIIAKVQSDPTVFTGNNPIRSVLTGASATGAGTVARTAAPTAARASVTAGKGPLREITLFDRDVNGNYPGDAAWQARHDQQNATMQAGRDAYSSKYGSLPPEGSYQIDTAGNIIPLTQEVADQMGTNRSREQQFHIGQAIYNEQVPGSTPVSPITAAPAEFFDEPMTPDEVSSLGDSGDSGNSGDSGDPGSPSSSDDDQSELRRGTYRVIKTGKRLVHKDETVLPKEVAAILRSLPGIPSKGHIMPKKPTLQPLVGVR